MSVDLSQFHQVFFEESYEGLEVMEAALMSLDVESIDSELVNTIFRSAHSIKGGSATFGFSSIANFTHEIETLLDEIRAGKRAFEADFIEIFLKSVDCIKSMLDSLSQGEDVEPEEAGVIKKKVLSILSSGGEAPIVDEKYDEVVADFFRHTISFEPKENIMHTGNDPVKIIKELVELGNAQVTQTQESWPSFKDVDPTACFLTWRIVLEGEVSEDEIRDVFDWVEDDAFIEIVSEALDQSKPEQDVTWDIVFSPHEAIMISGNDPLKVIAQLNQLGEMSITCNSEKLSDFSSTDCQHIFLAWNITITGAVDKSAIDSCFEWILDLADVSITTRIETNTLSQNIDEEQPKKSSKKEQKTNKKPGAVEASSIRVGIDKIDSLINMVGELVITQSMLGQLGEEFNEMKITKLQEGLSQLEQNTRELQESVMRIRMLPISFAFSRFPRMVRDLSQTLGKEINLELMGESTELDKTVMEKIGDPLVHLVRNAVDHGIESTDIRRESGKPEAGCITLNAFHQSGNVVIEIKDDGRGMDADAIKARAIDKNIITEQEAEMLPKEQILDLIFQPGFSTAAQVTDISGRGVGMDVVKRNIQSLNGSVELTSELGKGSVVTIRLPLTLAILDGQLVRVGTSTYVFPLISIVESLQCDTSEISSLAGGCNVFKLRDDYVPIIDLAHIFSLNKEVTQEKPLVVVVEHEGNKVGIVVDDLLAQQQVVIKSLEANYKRINGVSGATILGDGTVALIVDIPGLVSLSNVKMALNQIASMSDQAANTELNDVTDSEVI